MNQIDEWNAVSSRIRGLVRAGLLYAQFLAGSTDDSHGIGRELCQRSAVIVQAVNEFRDRHAVSLSQPSLDAIRRFADQTEKLAGKRGCSSPSSTREAAKTLMVRLSVFESEMSFLLTDLQEVIRARSERAFTHLQRLIIADPTVKAKWQEAFGSGELACEKLGAAHLLWHGIWAFKADAQGGRTDLILAEPPDEIQLRRCAEGLVLTEWKLARSPKEAMAAFSAASRQAARYCQDMLAGIELRRYRYAVVVSEKAVDVPTDEHPEGDVVYRHISIALDRPTPSRG